MAKIELNPAIGQIRGKMDGWVYRKLHGQTVAHSYRQPGKGKPTVAQKGQRKRFQAAQAYANEVLSDPLRRMAYQKIGSAGNRSANALLVSNFLTPPTIAHVELGGYAGRAGEELKVVVHDPIEVVDVTIRVSAVEGALLESGPATHEHGVWTYRATTTIPSRTSYAIQVVARNRARAEATQTIPRG